MWQLSYGISPRDLDIIEALGKVRVASVRQLQRLHFPSQARTARRCLLELTQRQIVTRLGRNVGGVRSGSAGHVYALDKVGQFLSGNGGPAHGARLRRPWTPGERFLVHALAVTEVYVRLVELTRVSDVELLEFEGEPKSWRSFLRLGGPAILKPDAFFRLGQGSEEAWFFLEVDQGTESGRTIETKAKVYRLYFETGDEQERHGVFPRVLWLVPDHLRGTQVQSAIEGAGARILSTVVTDDELVSALTDTNPTRAPP